MLYINLNIQRFADGKVVIETDLDNGGFSKGLDKMKSIAKTGFKAVTTSIGVASTAMAGLVMKSVTMAGDLEQQIGGTEAVFGDLADTVQKKAVKAFDQMGVSANDFMATANKMGSLMQGAGLSVEDSMKLSTEAMQRAADVASVMGIDTASAMESIAGAAKGNFTMMDNLGVAMNATTIEAYALSKGITTSYNEMDNATKVGLAMEMFLEKTSKYAGNYAAENETFAGSFSTLKAAMSNFLSGAGGIEDVTNALVDFGGILIESIGEMAPKVIDGITNLTNVLIPKIPEILQQLMPSILEGGISLINGLAQILPAFLTMIQDNSQIFIDGAMTIITTLVTTLIQNLPQLLQTGIQLIVSLVQGLSQQLPTLIPTIMQAYTNMIETLLDNIDLIIDAGIQLIIGLAEGLIDAIPQLIEKIPIIIEKLLTAITENLPKLVEMGITLIVKLAEGLIKAIPQLVKQAPQIITALVKALSEGIKSIKEVGKNLISGLWNGIKEKWEGLKNKVKDFGKGIVDKFKSVFGIKSPSRVMRDQIGKYLAEGVGVGFEDAIDGVYKDMQKAVDIETEKMSANVQTSGVYQIAMNGTPTFNLLDNTNNRTQLVVDGKILADVVNTENRHREVAKA